MRAPGNDLLTTKDAGKRLGLSAEAVYLLAKRGVIPSVLAGRLLFIPEAVLDRLHFSRDDVIEFVMDREGYEATGQQANNRNGGSDSHERTKDR